MKQNTSISKSAQSGNPWLIVGLAGLFLTLGIALAAATAVIIMRIAAWHGGAINDWLIDKGADRVMRRCILIYGIAFLLTFLKYAGWRGWRDCGFSYEADVRISPNWRAGILRGIILGFITMGGLSVIAWLFDIRIITAPENWADMPRLFLSYLSSGVVVGLLEETICRGILFRVFARLWRLWPAALLSSGIFALSHFLSPTPEAFEAATFFKAVWQVYLDTFVNLSRSYAFGMRFFNLTLLGVVLCAFLARSGDIWFSAGIHAAWVWVIKFHHLLTDHNPDLPPGIWFGVESDFTDSLLASAMLLTLLAVGGFRRRAPEILFKHAGMSWHALPGLLDKTKNWLHANLQVGTGPARPFQDAGRELKAYDGCRIAALDGVVVKICRPRSGPRGWRFPLRPCRARRAFDTAFRLNDMGIPTPTALAWSAIRCWRLRQSEYLLTIELSGAQPLESRLSQPGLSPEDRKKILAEYGRLTAKFHIQKFSNRDLKYENVMIDSGNDRLWVVDLDGIREKHYITRRRAARDLFRIGDCLAKADWADPADIQAFFSGYNGLTPTRLHRLGFPSSH